ALVNQAPAFATTPVQQAVAGEPYAYEVAASDPDGDPLTISASSVLPAWLALQDHGDGTATLSGTPAIGDAGTVSVELQVSDGTAAGAQAFDIEVLGGDVFRDGFEAADAP